MKTSRQTGSLEMYIQIFMFNSTATTKHPLLCFHLHVTQRSDGLRSADMVNTETAGNLIG